MIRPEQHTPSVDLRSEVDKNHNVKMTGFCTLFAVASLAAASPASAANADPIKVVDPTNFANTIDYTSDQRAKKTVGAKCNLFAPFPTRLSLFGLSEMIEGYASVVKCSDISQPPLKVASTEIETCIRRVIFVKKKGKYKLVPKENLGGCSQDFTGGIPANGDIYKNTALCLPVEDAPRGTNGMFAQVTVQMKFIGNNGAIAQGKKTGGQVQGIGCLPEIRYRD